MNIRKGLKSDTNASLEIYNQVILNEEKNGKETGWSRGVYPTEDVILDGLQNGDFYVLEDDSTAEKKVQACCRINHDQPAFYSKIDWSKNAQDEKIMVLHTLAVNPFAQGKSYGKAFLDFYETCARDCGCEALRLDTTDTNMRAQAFYKKNGFCERGRITSDTNGIPDITFVCLEKIL